MPAARRLRLRRRPAAPRFQIQPDTAGVGSVRCALVSRDAQRLRPLDTAASRDTAGVAQVRNVCRNVTTNELANRHRYAYLSRPGPPSSPHQRLPPPPPRSACGSPPAAVSLRQPRAALASPCHRRHAQRWPSENPPKLALFAVIAHKFCFFILLAPPRIVGGGDCPAASPLVRRVPTRVSHLLCTPRLGAQSAPRRAGSTTTPSTAEWRPT